MFWRIGNEKIITRERPFVQEQREQGRVAAAVTDCAFGLVRGQDWTELAKEAASFHSFPAPTPATLSSFTIVRHCLAGFRLRCHRVFCRRLPEALELPGRIDNLNRAAHNRSGVSAAVHITFSTPRAAVSH